MHHDHESVSPCRKEGRRVKGREGNVVSADQKNLGMSMRVKKSTLEDVKERFQLKKAEKEEKKKEYDYQERIRELQEEVLLYLN